MHPRRRTSLPGNSSPSPSINFHPCPPYSLSPCHFISSVLPTNHLYEEAYHGPVVWGRGRAVLDLSERSLRSAFSWWWMAWRPLYVGRRAASKRSASYPVNFCAVTGAGDARPLARTACPGGGES